MSSVEVPPSQSSNPNDTFDVHRPNPSATFSPSIWGDHFLSHASLLNLIDDIQRLGVSYHFGNEIEEVLQKIHKSSYDLDDLYTAALRFRLLRQQGYNVSCDLFNNFKDGDGKFKESLVDDVVGLLSLYEATHLRIHGEEILDEALTFTTTNLESATFRLSPPLAKAVTHALNQPLRKGLPRVEARYYLSVYQELRESPNETLLTFAKLDFNRLQRVHQKELSEITRWWKDLDVPNKLPFARDRLVEVYFCWSMSVYFQPQYSFARRTSCKVTAMTSIIDDLYEYGTYEQLELFTEAIERSNRGGYSSSWACALVQISPYTFSAIGIAVAISVSVLGAAWFIPFPCFLSIQ